jgi:hypothetical protein
MSIATSRTRSAPLLARDNVRAFGRDLQRSGRASIDAFLDTRRDFLPIGKAAIARVLTDYEVDNHLTTSRSNEGWYHYLFDKMFPPALADFRKNQLSVVTFNFDRSFERALLFLMANYGIDEAEATEYAQCIRVLHIHGQLGPLWPVDGQDGRPYRPLLADPVLRAKELRDCARQIRIIHEEVEGPILNAAVELMAHAHFVCFLGFGYHEVNLKRLRTHKLGSPDKQVMGTNLGMYKGEWDGSCSARSNRWGSSTERLFIAPIVNRSR